MPSKFPYGAKERRKRIKDDNRLTKMWDDFFKKDAEDHAKQIDPDYGLGDPNQNFVDALEAKRSKARGSKGFEV